MLLNNKPVLTNGSFLMVGGDFVDITSPLPMKFCCEDKGEGLVVEDTGKGLVVTIDPSVKDGIVRQAFDFTDRAGKRTRFDVLIYGKLGMMVGPDPLYEISYLITLAEPLA